MDERTSSTFFGSTQGHVHLKIAIAAFKQHFRLLLLFAFTSMVAIGSVLFRTAHFNTVFYGFLVWNLFLAWAPVLPAMLLVNQPTRKVWGYITAGCLMLIWLVLFPNSPYILTDIIYLKPLPWVPFWFDIFMFFTFTWNGLFLGFFSLLLVHRFIEQRLSVRNLSWLPISLILLLSSYGIYLGRFRRWNSWDVISRPFDLSSDVLQPFFNPGQHFTTFGFVFLYAGFLLISYAAVKLIYDAGGTDYAENGG